jgi:hypothetical protein
LKQEGIVTQETIDSVRKTHFEELDGHLKASYSYKPEVRIVYKDKLEIARFSSRKMVQNDCLYGT